MDITPQIPIDTNFINGYGSKGLKINNQLIVDHIVLTSKTINKWCLNTEIFDLENYKQLIKDITAGKISNGTILIIGTGNNHVTPPSQFLKFINQYHIHPEIMSTPAACRTFNVLIEEQRNLYEMLINIVD